MLPAGLEHLTLDLKMRDGQPVQFPTGALRRLQQLTCLELAGMALQAPDEGDPPLQPLEALTRLVDLRIRAQGDNVITSRMLSSTSTLTRLELWGALPGEPMGAPYGDGLGDLPAGSAGMSLRVHAGVLAKKPQLQHVVLYGCQLSGDLTGVAQLLCRA